VYLEGQLPLGPDTSNVGGVLPPIPSAVLDTTIHDFAIEGAGPDVISGSVAQVDGIVQPPVTNTISQASPLQFGGSAFYDLPQGSYARDGSLTTLRNRAGRGMGWDAGGFANSGCPAGDAIASPASPSFGFWALAGALALVVVGLGDGGKR